MPSHDRRTARWAPWLAALALTACGHEAETATVRPEPATTSASAQPDDRSPGATAEAPAAPPAAIAATPAAAAGAEAERTEGAGAEPGTEGAGSGTEGAGAEASAGAGGGTSAGSSALAVPTTPPVPSPVPEVSPPSLHDAIRQVVRMPADRALNRAARSHRMRIQSLSWEDTGRYAGSSVGPNISDLTLEVFERLPPTRSGRARQRTYLLPVLRYPNFTDRTADVPADRFWVRVGNQRAGAAPTDLSPVPLTEVLSHLRTYLSDPDSLRSASDDFTAPRDTHYLVSAQHVFVPLPDGVRVEWAPVLFNYQSEPGMPAVLCLVITREGTSIQIIENRPDPIHPEGWGQRLYFNHGGQRTLFTAERRSDVAERIEAGQARPEDATALEEGADMVMIVQVPLRLPYQSPRSAASGGLGGGMGYGSGAGGFAAPASRSASDGSAESDVERAVVGHGLEEGPLAEVRNRRIRRDPRFPIRVTVQFYRATSNGVVSEEDLDAAVSTIERVYSEADYVGSLVVGSQERPTSWIRPSPPAGDPATP
ncbi:MAG: hypothetical protein K1X94_12845 [Sandaracinaceae bacterium]|nr:hypothetical protein [Sandaracinaceae bacterium]